jgi:hypothetical protein
MMGSRLLATRSREELAAKASASKRLKLLLSAMFVRSDLDANTSGTVIENCRHNIGATVASCVLG